VITPFKLESLPGLITLLNQIVLLAAIEVELKLDEIDPFTTHVTVLFGFTVTTTFSLFVHSLVDNVYTYVTLTGDEVVLTNVSLISPIPEAAALLIPLAVARLHVNVVFGVVVVAL
jgi:hypothetical protein